MEAKDFLVFCLSYLIIYDCLSANKEHLHLEARIVFPFSHYIVFTLNVIISRLCVVTLTYVYSPGLPVCVWGGGGGAWSPCAPLSTPVGIGLLRVRNNVLSELNQSFRWELTTHSLLFSSLSLV